MKILRVLDNILEQFRPDIPNQNIDRKHFNPETIGLMKMNLEEYNFTCKNGGIIAKYPGDKRPKKAKTSIMIGGSSLTGEEALTLEKELKFQIFLRGCNAGLKYCVCEHYTANNGHYVTAQAVPAIFYKK